ncbi:hypothetical protein D9M72_633350 [compost metagenome]
MISSLVKSSDADLASGKQRDLPLHCQQITFMGDREEPERTDVFNRADDHLLLAAKPKAEAKPSALKSTIQRHAVALPGVFNNLRFQ